MSDDHTHESTQALTAFVVVVPADGSVCYVDPDFKSYEIQRKATFADVRRATADVFDDYSAKASASYATEAFRDLITQAAQPAPKKRGK